jgi:tetratricopeptide (TPR) repeat protein
MAPRALVIVVCLLAGGCSASLPEARPLARGFFPTAGVLAPYEDGKRHLAAGRYGLAVERFGQVLARDRRSLDALNGLAIGYARLGRFDVAQAYFERALAVDAFDVATLNNYGRALVEQGRLRDARPFLQLALDQAAPADGAVIAANLESMGSSRPSALVAALRQPDRGQEADGHRLIRLAANRYRLESPGRPVARAEPAIVPAHASLATPAALAEPPQADPAPETGPAIVLAAGIGGPGLELASAADLEALGLGLDEATAEPQVTAAHAALPSRPVAASRATGLLPGEPT